MNVPTFAGAITDGRAKYLDWAERAKDRINLFDAAMSKALKTVENKTKPITEDESIGLGISETANNELQ